MADWALKYQDYVPAQERLREALCTLGNGYFATRGAAEEAAADEHHYPGTYLAGGYNRLRTEIKGHTVENEDLVNFPNWLPIRFRLPGGDWFDPGSVELRDYRQRLDLHAGVLGRAVRFRDEQGRHARLRARRLVHMADAHVAAIEFTVVPEDFSGEIEFLVALDGRISNQGVARYRELNGDHLEHLASDVDGDILILRTRTCQSRLEVAQAARTEIYRDGGLENPRRHTVAEDGYVAQRFAVPVEQGQAITLEKIVSLYSSQDRAISECGLAAHAKIRRIGRFAELHATHVRAWKHLWQRFDVRIESRKSLDGMAMNDVVRLHVFHLLQTASPHTRDLDVSVPARGLHGEAYRGHIFWDELFIFPLLNWRMPEITRALLLYRYRRLGEARAAAWEAGYRGAMYPWQSGSSGREESQVLHLNPRSQRWVPDHTQLQRHVNLAIAYNIWQYYQVTHDIEFLVDYGAEVILEIARFWSSLATYDRELERYEICGVMGPDEYHDAYPGAEQPGLDNNAYTNVMVVWLMRRAREILEMLPPERRTELTETLDLSSEETDRWDEISRRMRIVFHGDRIISQFEGYDELEEFDWEGYRRKYGNIQRLDRILEQEGHSPNTYKASKQADVLMLFYLLSAEELRDLFERLGYQWDPELIPRNIDYYLARTPHGSTLSAVVHAWVLARANREEAWALFNRALVSDIHDVQGGTTEEGIHLGAMAGTVDLMQRNYTGIETRGDILRVNPCLPRRVDSLVLRVRYRGHPIEMRFDHQQVTLEAGRGRSQPVRVGYRDQERQLAPGATVTFELQSRVGEAQR